MVYEIFKIEASQRKMCLFQKYCKEARGHSGTRPGKMAEANPVSMMHTNGSFVISLLKECKAKVREHASSL